MAAMALGSDTPPAPNPQPDQPSVSLGMGSAPQIPRRRPWAMALGGGGQQQQQPQQQQMPMPAPTYGQTLAALRHFGAMRREMQRVMRDPALGKSSVKKQIVDGVAELVANRILSPGDAVKLLMEVPDRPYDQKVWLQQCLQLIDQSQQKVITHYRESIKGVPAELIDRHGDPEEHMQDIAALMGHYRPGGQR